MLVFPGKQVGVCAVFFKHMSVKQTLGVPFVDTCPTCDCALLPFTNWQHHTWKLLILSHVASTLTHILHLFLVIMFLLCSDKNG